VILDQATISYFQRPPDVAVRGHGRTWPSTLRGMALNSIVAIKSATYPSGDLILPSPERATLPGCLASSN